MTNEEQIKAYRTLRENGKAFFIDNYEDADRIIDALEAQNKYRWHDLRKDPDDLPNEDSIEFIVCVEYRNGKRECTVGCLDMGGEMMLLPTLGNWIGNSYHIIAWREIEPFERVNE